MTTAMTITIVAITSLVTTATTALVPTVELQTSVVKMSTKWNRTVVDTGELLEDPIFN